MTSFVIIIIFILFYMDYWYGINLKCIGLHLLKDLKVKMNPLLLNNISADISFWEILRLTEVWNQYI